MRQNEREKIRESQVAHSVCYDKPTDIVWSFGWVKLKKNFLTSYENDINNMLDNYYKYKNYFKMNSAIFTD